MKNALRRRVTPSYPLQLIIRDADGSTFEVNLRLSYDFNAMALVEERTGLSMFDGTIFKKPSAANLSVLLWAGAQENHADDYAGDEGLRVIRSYLSLENAASAQKAINEAFLASLSPEQAEAIRKTAAEGSGPLAPEPPSL